MNPAYEHEFDPNCKGKCKVIVRGSMCHLTEDAVVHQRYREKEERESKREAEREAVEDNIAKEGRYAEFVEFMNRYKWQEAGDE